MDHKHSLKKTSLIWILSILTFLFVAFHNNTTEAFPPQLNYESIYQGRVFLHIYDTRNRDYINDTINTTFNHRVLITARVTIYSTAPFSTFSNRDIVVQFDELSEISRRYITNSTYFISHSSYQLSDNNNLSPCICSNNYCMQCRHNIGSQCALANSIVPFCYFDISNKFSYRTLHTPGTAGFISGNYFVSFMY